MIFTYTTVDVLAKYNGNYITSHVFITSTSLMTPASATNYFYAKRKCTKAEMDQLISLTKHVVVQAVVG